MTRDDAWLLDIAQAARDILDFRAELDAVAFHNDRLRQAAIMHRLMVIGEAAKRLSEEFRQSHPDQPWQQIAGMRDRLIHGYNKVRIDVVWQVVEVDIPSLLEFAQARLPDSKEGGDSDDSTGT